MDKHVCSLGNQFHTVACDDDRKGFWYVEDGTEENMIMHVSFCPFCGTNLHDLNKIVCTICKGKSRTGSLNCMACFSTGWEQAPEPEDGVEAPIYGGLMEKIKENQKEKQSDK